MQGIDDAIATFNARGHTTSKRDYIGENGILIGRAPINGKRNFTVQTSALELFQGQDSWIVVRSSGPLIPRTFIPSIREQLPFSSLQEAVDYCIEYLESDIGIVD